MQHLSQAPSTFAVSLENPEEKAQDHPVVCYYLYPCSLKVKLAFRNDSGEKRGRTRPAPVLAHPSDAPVGLYGEQGRFRQIFTFRKMANEGDSCSRSITAQ